MVPVDEASEIILSSISRLEVEEVPLRESLGRILVREVTSDVDMPPFDRAAMDGFAVRSKDTVGAPCALKLAGVVQAGGLPTRPVEPGETVAIMTGAPVPPGADAVVPVELSRSLGHERVEILAAVSPGRHVAPRASEVAVGDRTLEAGITIDPAVVAVLAAAGLVQVPVGRRPRVGLLVTGDELVDAGQSPPPGCIRNTNGPTLAALIRSAGGEVTDLGVVRDRPEEIEEALRRGLASDALVTSGGVSEGLFDLVEPALERLGIRFHFTAVAVKPGKPFAFGSAGTTRVFALPGNPVSAQVTFEIFVRPALRRMQHAAVPAPLEIVATLDASLTNTSAREAYVPVRIETRDGGLVATPLPSKGSADVFAHARASGLAIVPAHRIEVAIGERIRVLPLPGLAERGGARYSEGG